MANGVKIPPVLANSIIVLVALMFGANFFAVFFIPGWKPDPFIYGVFTTIMGGSYMLSKSGKNGTPPTPPADGGGPGV